MTPGAAAFIAAVTQAINVPPGETLSSPPTADFMVKELSRPELENAFYTAVAVATVLLTTRRADDVDPQTLLRRIALQLS